MHDHARSCTIIRQTDRQRQPAGQTANQAAGQTDSFPAEAYDVKVIVLWRLLDDRGPRLLRTTADRAFFQIIRPRTALVADVRGPRTAPIAGLDRG